MIINNNPQSIKKYIIDIKKLSINKTILKYYIFGDIMIFMFED